MARAARALVLLALTAVVVVTEAPRTPSALRPADAAGAVGAVGALRGFEPRTPPDLTRLRAELPPGVHPPAAPSTAVPTPSPAAASSTAAPARSAAPPSQGPAPTAAPARPPAAPAGRALPLPVNTGGTTQVVTVVAASSWSTTATVTAWQLGAGGWSAVVGPVPARIGSAGVGTASEDSTRTPAGTFTLTEGFGRLGDPGTRLPYRVINAADWWVSDRTSSLYNQFYECGGACPFKTVAGEHLVDAGSSYDYALVIDYNRHPVTPGAGSAFFLHVTNGAATAGCVAIPRSRLLAIMRWLDPGAHPLIAIGVG